MDFAKRRPAMRASYSASLLDALKLKRKAYSTPIRFGEVRIRPAPLPVELEEPST
ncbi:hypothetical protein LguiA_021227 [Lonicera macranthoides]